jgi:4-aminobutyrate aminotransferase-like enzyme
MTTISAIAVTTVGNAAPRVVEQVRAQAADVTHTCFMITPYEEYVPAPRSRARPRWAPSRR